MARRELRCGTYPQRTPLIHNAVAGNPVYKRIRTLVANRPTPLAVRNNVRLAQAGHWNGDMLNTLSTPDPLCDTQPSEPSDTAQRLGDAGYPTEAIALLGISSLHGVGFQTMVRLGGRDGIRGFLKAKDVRHFERAIGDAGGRLPAGTVRAEWSDLRRQIWTSGTHTASLLAAAGVKFCFLGDPEFPKAFIGLPSAYQPMWLFYRGDITVLDRSSITIVGTRQPTLNGDFLARYSVSCAREFDAPVISGLAQGIDRIVHEWCLQIGLPTVSVMGTGMLTTYPAKHAVLGDSIVAAGGLLISEYLPQQGPTGENFVWRNRRLQSALGRVVIPAEWARKSGTAHTVRFARKLSRPVFSISLSGAQRAPDAGDGDRHFELPRDHAAFMEALRSEVSAPVHSKIQRQARWTSSAASLDGTEAHPDVAGWNCRRGREGQA
jgi:DNA processing protein